MYVYMYVCMYVCMSEVILVFNQNFIFAIVLSGIQSPPNHHHHHTALSIPFPRDFQTCFEPDRGDAALSR